MTYQNKTSAVIKNEIMALAQNLGIQKSQIKVKCNKSRGITVLYTDLISKDLADNLRVKVSDLYDYYNRNADDPTADYPDYRTNLIGYNHIWFEWDYSAEKITTIICQLKDRLDSILGNNHVIPYLREYGILCPYPVGCCDIARALISHVTDIDNLNFNISGNMLNISQLK